MTARERKAWLVAVRKLLRYYEAKINAEGSGIIHYCPLCDVPEDCPECLRALKEIRCPAKRISVLRLRRWEKRLMKEGGLR